MRLWFVSQTALLGNHKDAEFQKKLAGDYIKAGAPEKAFDALTLAVSLDPNDTSAHKCLAVAFIATKLDFDSAIHEYKRALATPSSDQPELEERLRLALANKDSITELVQKSANYPEDADAHSTLAFALFRLTILGTSQQAERECKRAYSLTSDPIKEAYTRDSCADERIKRDREADQANQGCPFR